MRYKSINLTRYLLLAFAVLLITTGAVQLAMPDLEGVEDGVVLKIKNGKKVRERFISPSMPGFVRSEKLPKHVYGAIITSEDEDFYTHHGISLNETIEAAKFDITHFTLKHGGSTITQQLAKNLYLNGRRTFTRKLAEAIIAMKLEKKLTKRQILNYYLNIAEFGKGIYGLKQAANYYFNKSPEDLTAKEAAMLAVIMPKPESRGQALYENGSKDFQKRRVANLLWRMRENGYITEGADGA